MTNDQEVLCSYMKCVMDTPLLGYTNEKACMMIIMPQVIFNVKWDFDEHRYFFKKTLP